MRMTHTFKLARRAARFRAPLLTTILALAFGACDTADKLTNTTADATDPTSNPIVEAGALTLEDSLAIQDSLAAATADPTGGLPILDDDASPLDEEDVAAQVQVVDGPALASTASALEGTASLITGNRSGIPFGAFHLPSSLYGALYTGSLVNSSSSVGSLLPYLAAAKRVGARVVVSFVGADKYYKNPNGTFSLTKWKHRVDAYRGVNFASYVKDGTIIAHYILDEPHDPRNWAGTTVSRATIDEMARYSKSIWPTMPVVIRGKPAYLRGYNYRYLDAAWAQYAARFGSIPNWLNSNVGDARAAGLALIVGMNTLAGSNSSGLRGYYAPGYYSMTANQIKSWGAQVMANSYPCAFLNWRYNAVYMGRTDIRLAHAYLSAKAKAKPIKTCRGS